MHVRRGFLFAGLFFIPVGAITLLVRAGTIDPNSLVDAWRLWPLILVGFGIALLLGRGRAASFGTAAAALVLGVMVGSVIASGPVWVGGISECGATGGATQQVAKSGTFGSPASIDIRLRCGSVSLATRSGSDWTVTADYQGPPPVISGAVDRLEITVPEVSGTRRDDLTIKAPADRLRSLLLQSNAATATVVLDGATVGTVKVDSNAGDVLVDGGSAAIQRIDVSINAGRARITLGGGPTAGDLSVNVGAIDLCVPAAADLRLVVDDQLTFVTNLASRGLQQNGQTWSRTASGGGSSIDLHVEGNAGSLTLDPDGGCR